MDISVDHKPTRPDEEARIRAAGGSVVKSRLQGVLGVSRAFGDIEMKALKARFEPPVQRRSALTRARRGAVQENLWNKKFTGELLVADPEVLVREVQPEDEFIVIACDGIWDVMSSAQACVRIAMSSDRD